MQLEYARHFMAACGLCAKENGRTRRDYIKIVSAPELRYRSQESD